MNSRRRRYHNYYYDKGLLVYDNDDDDDNSSCSNNNDKNNDKVSTFDDDNDADMEQIQLKQQQQQKPKAIKQQTAIQQDDMPLLFSHLSIEHVHDDPIDSVDLNENISIMNFSANPGTKMLAKDNQTNSNSNENQSKDSNSSNSTTIKCPICSKTNRKLFCAICIRAGNFTHSTRNFLERFSEKKLKFIRLKEQQLNECCELQKHYENDNLMANLRTRIKQIERNISIFTEIKLEKCQIIKEMANIQNKYEREHLQMQKKQLDIRGKIKRLHSNLSDLRYRLQNNYYYRNHNHESLRECQTLKCQRLNQLQMYIFPIVEYLHSSNLKSDNQRFAGDFTDDLLDDEDAEDPDNPESLPLIQDSDMALGSGGDNGLMSQQQQQQNYVQKFKIIETVVDVNESFEISELLQPNHYSAKNMDIYLDDKNFRNNYYRSMSALGSICYLTNLFSIIYRIHLPQKLLFSDLTFNTFNSQSQIQSKCDLFRSQIAQLNANILFLCYWFRLDMASDFEPKQMLRNLKMALDAAINVQQQQQQQQQNHHLELRPNFFRMVHNELMDKMSVLNALHKDSPLRYGQINDDHREQQHTNQQQINDCKSNKLNEPVTATTIIKDDDNENEYDIVENNIPDLKFDNPFNTTNNLDDNSSNIAGGAGGGGIGMIASLVSSFYKRK